MAKKQDDQTPTQLEPTSDLVALNARMDQMLDIIAEQADTIDTLKAAQTGVAATVVKQDDKQAELDAELDTLLEEFKDYPLAQVFAQRAIHGVDAGIDIRLKGEVPYNLDPEGKQRTWKLRWFNFEKEGRAQQAQAEGYEKVKWDELQDRESLDTGETTDGFVRKGEKGLQWLHKMPLKLYDYKKKRDAHRRDGLLTSERQLRDHLANGVASRAGKSGMNADQAGSFAHSKISMTISQGKTERYNPDQMQ
jgi:hypothetical protein